MQALGHAKKGGEKIRRAEFQLTLMLTTPLSQEFVCTHEKKEPAAVAAAADSSFCCYCCNTPLSGGSETSAVTIPKKFGTVKAGGVLRAFF